MTTLIAYFPEMNVGGPPVTCFWTDLVGSTENCADAAGVLTKITITVLIPGVQARDYRPYSKSCPTPAPWNPPNAPVPGQHCYQVPIYAPNPPPSGGGPGEGGTPPSTIIGYTTVCAP